MPVASPNKETWVMIRILPTSLAAALATALLAQGAPSAAFAASKPKEIVVVGSKFSPAHAIRYSGKYLLTQVRHNARVTKVDGFAVKQKVLRAFNPKEFTITENVPWK
jgi:hypothetical protein